MIRRIAAAVLVAGIALTVSLGSAHAVTKNDNGKSTNVATVEWRKHK